MGRKPGNTAAIRARRLLTLLPHLRRGLTFSLTALAESLGAKPPELAEDLTALSMCGLPPYTADVMVELVVDGDLVRVLSDPPALTEHARLSPAEARALLAAVRAVGVGEDDPLIGKLEALAQPGFSAEELARALRTESGGETGVRGVVAAAIDAGEVLDIDYEAVGGGSSCRAIQPYALTTSRGAWFVSAYCESADARRTFRLDRIRAATPAGRYFDPPSDTTPLPLPFEVTALPEAQVRFDAEEPGLTEREWPGATFERDAGGAILARIPYARPQWLARRVAALLGRAEVLSPPEMRAAVSELAARMSGEPGSGSDTGIA